MDKYPLLRKDLAVGIILLFVRSKLFTSCKTQKSISGTGAISKKIKL